MPAAAIVTIVLAAVAVLVIAAFLITIAETLREVSVELDKVISVVGQIPERTAPIEPVLAAINKDLSGGRAFLEGLLTGVPPIPVARPTRSVSEPVAAPVGPPGAAVADAPREPEHAPLLHPSRLLPGQGGDDGHRAPVVERDDSHRAPVEHGADDSHRAPVEHAPVPHPPKLLP